MNEKSYFKELNGYYVKDEEARESIGSITADVTNLEKEVNGKLYLGAFFDPTANNKISVFVSKDGIDYKKLNIELPFSGRDISIKYNKFNKKFYATYTTSASNSTIKIWTSPDFKNWTENTSLINGLTGNITWAPDLFIDDDGKLYVVISNQYGTEIDKTQNTIPAFDMYLLSCNDIDQLTFDTAQLITLTGASNRNHIDGSLCKIGDTYYLICKDEKDKLTEIYESTDLSTFTIANDNVINSSYFIEGAQLVPTDTGILFIGDGYTTHKMVVNKTSYNDFPTFGNTFKVAKTLYAQRHGSVDFIDGVDAINIIKSLDGFSTEEVELYEDVNFINITTITAGTTHLLDFDDLPIVPDTVYQFGGGSSTVYNVNLSNPFGCDVFRMRFASSSGTTVNITTLNGVTLREPIKIVNDADINEHVIDVLVNGNYTQAKFGHHGTFTVSASEITNVNQNFTFKNGSFFKKNGIVTFVLRFTCNTDYSSGSGWIDIATLPAGFTPVTTVLADNSVGSLNLQVNSGTRNLSGNITMSSGRELMVSATYICKD